MLISTGSDPWHWAIAGVAIAAITTLLLLVANKRLGVSTGFENLCALTSKRPYFLRPDLGPAGRWRLQHHQCTR